jgi:hypothetical protein
MKNSLENAQTSNFALLASRKETNSANDNFQFFPGINTSVPQVWLDIFNMLKESHCVYKRACVFLNS